MAKGEWHSSIAMFSPLFVALFFKWQICLYLKFTVETGLVPTIQKTAHQMTDCFQYISCMTAVNIATPKYTLFLFFKVSRSRASFSEGREGGGGGDWGFCRREHVLCLVCFCTVLSPSQQAFQLNLFSFTDESMQKFEADSVTSLALQNKENCPNVFEFHQTKILDVKVVSNSLVLSK